MALSMSHQELLNKLAEFPTIEKMLTGAHLRNKTVSRAGKSSAVIFVPQYLLGQKYQVLLVPEGKEVSAVSEALEKKYNENAVLKYKNRKMEEKYNDIESSKPEEKKEDKEDSLEEDDIY